MILEFLIFKFLILSEFFLRNAVRAILNKQKEKKNRTNETPIKQVVKKTREKTKSFIMTIRHNRTLS